MLGQRKESLFVAVKSFGGMGDKMKILGFAGSLRKGSYNKMALNAATKLAPDDVKIEVFDLKDIPPFNQDLEQYPPERVREFKKKIREADAILIATPEYNYSIPGVLKNAIDWTSRPYGDNVFEGKPVAIMGASIGNIGTARAQYHLRQCFVFLDMYPINQPEVMIGFAQEKFDKNGNLTDEHAKDRIKELLQELVQWAKTLKGK